MNLLWFTAWPYIVIGAIGMLVAVVWLGTDEVGMFDRHTINKVVGHSISDGTEGTTSEKTVSKRVFDYPARLTCWIILAALSIVAIVSFSIVSGHNNGVWHAQLPSIAQQQGLKIDPSSASYVASTVTILGDGCTVTADVEHGKIVLDATTPSMVLTPKLMKVLCG